MGAVRGFDSSLTPAVLVLAGRYRVERGWVTETPARSKHRSYCDSWKHHTEMSRLACYYCFFYNEKVC